MNGNNPISFKPVAGKAVPRKTAETNPKYIEHFLVIKIQSFFM